MTTPKTGERRFDPYDAPAASVDGVASPGPLADLLDFWLDEFAEADGDPNPGQVAGCIATFSGFPGVYDAAAFTDWLIAESIETLDEKVDDADENEEPVEDGRAAPDQGEPRVGTGQNNNPTGKNQSGRHSHSHSHGGKTHSHAHSHRGTHKSHSHRHRSLELAGERRSAPGKVERRSFTISGLKVEQRSSDGKRVMRGHAAVFNSTSADLGGFREQVAPGAFTRALEAGQDVRALINHDPNLVLGRSKAGTLRLSQDETGLAVEIDPPDTTYARDLITSMERGDIDQMSFTFRTVKDSWAQSPAGTMRTLLDVDLLDVSPVTYPAYAATDIAARSAQESPTADPDLEAKDRLAAMRRRLRLAQAI